MFNRLYFNAAYAGSEKGINSVGVFRDQWTGFPNNPVSSNFSIDAPLNKIHSGVGGTILYDQLGIEKTLIAKTSYSYKILRKEKKTLSIGIDAGIINNLSFV